MELKFLDTFSKKIAHVRRASMGVPKMITINLALPLVDQEYNISGNLFCIWQTSTYTDYVNIKVNNSSEPAIPYMINTGLVTPFEKLLITTPGGQVGNMVIIYGTEAPELLQIIDNRTSKQILGTIQGFYGVEVTVNAAASIILFAAQTINSNRSIQAKSTNTGIVYLGFDATVTITQWFKELQAGASWSADDYCGAIYARADIAGQLVGLGSW